MRWLLRLLGFLAVAGAIVLFIIDATRMIANNTLAATPLGQTLFALFPASFPMLEPAITRHLHPWLWDPVVLSLLLLPTALVVFLLGLLLLWLGRPPARPIGYSSRDD